MQLEQRFLVWKLSDLDQFLTSEEKAFLYHLQQKIRLLRTAQGKEQNQYVVINQGGSYFPDVLKLIEEHS